MKLQYAIGIILTTAVLSACGETQYPTTTGGSNSILEMSVLSQEELDQLLPGGDSEIAKEFPDYAGVYKDGSGYHIQMKNGRSEEVKGQSISNVYKKIAEFYPIYNDQIKSQSSLSYNKVKYSYIDLANYKKIILDKDSTYINGVGFSPQDNMLTITIRDISKLEEAKREIIGLKIPEDAFKIISIKLSTVATATSLARPAPASLAVNPIVPGISAVCSMGPLVQNTTTKVVGFLIARHCVTSIGDNVTQGGQSIGQVHAISSITTGSTRDMAIVSTPLGNIRATYYAYMDTAQPNIAVSSYSSVEKYLSRVQK